MGKEETFTPSEIQKKFWEALRNRQVFLILPTRSGGLASLIRALKEQGIFPPTTASSATKSHLKLVKGSGSLHGNNS